MTARKVLVLNEDIAPSGQAMVPQVGDSFELPRDTNVTGTFTVNGAPVTGGSGAQNKLDGTVAPTVTNDSSEGYTVSSFWVDEVADEAYRCLDSSVGAAVWVKTTLDIAELAAVAVSGDSDDLTEGATNLLMTPEERSALTLLSAGGNSDLPSGVVAGDRLVWTPREYPMDRAGWTASLDSQYSDNTPGKALDGSNTTFAMSDSGTGHWLAVDTQTEVTAVRLRILSMSDVWNDLDCVLETSDDNSTWTQQGDSFYVLGANIYINVDFDAPITSRYWRLRTLNGTYFQVVEFDLVPAAEWDIAPDNTAPDGTTAGDLLTWVEPSTYDRSSWVIGESGHYSVDIPEQAFDGSLATWWSSTISSNSWISFDALVPLTTDEMIFITTNAWNDTSAFIQSSDDGVTWTRRSDDYSIPKNSTINITFTKATARYWRLKQFGDYTYTQFYDIQVVKPGYWETNAAPVAAEPGMVTLRKAVNYTLNANEKIYADSAVGPLDFTLPLTPSDGDKCSVWDNGDNAHNARININANGETITLADGSTDTDIDINMAGGRIDFMYDVDTWRYSYVVQTIQPSTVVTRTGKKLIRPEDLALYNGATKVTTGAAGLDTPGLSLSPTGYPQGSGMLSFPPGWTRQVRHRVVWRPTNTNTGEFGYAAGFVIVADGTVVGAREYPAAATSDIGLGVADNVQTSAWSDWFTLTGDPLDPVFFNIIRLDTDTFTGNAEVILVEVEYTTEETLTAAVSNDPSSHQIIIDATTYTVQNSDNGHELIFTNAAGCAVTLPDSLAERFQFVATWAGAVAPAVTPVTETINGAGTAISPVAQWGGVHLTKYTSTGWIGKGAA